MTPEFQKIADEIRSKIELYAQNTYDDGHRTHLGTSLIGHECKRYLWFTFRWVYHHKHSGRMQRLFNTGHKEEARIIEWLRGAGYQVWNLDENGKQFRISDFEGHFGGSTDGIIFIPGLGNCLFEAKTNKTGTEFKTLIENGMQMMKPRHWGQTCTYGKKLGLKYCLYINKNKDNDDLHIEILELDHAEGQRNLDKAAEIIGSQEAPPRLAETPAYHKCKYCDYVDVCHRGKEIENNCRSCKSARPGPNATWICGKFNDIEIPKEEIGKSKPCWKGIY